VSTPYSATREASKSDRNSSYNWGGTAHRRPHTSFLCEDFFYGEEKYGNQTMATLGKVIMKVKW